MYVYLIQQSLRGTTKEDLLLPTTLHRLICVLIFRLRLSYNFHSFIIPTFSHWQSHAVRADSTTTSDPYSRPTPFVQWLTALPYAFSLATDVILTSTLILILHKSRTGMRRYVSPVCLPSTPV